MTTILLVLQLLQANPQLFQSEATRPFATVPTVELIEEITMYAPHEAALAQFQLEAQQAMRRELAGRYEAASLEERQQIIEVIK